MGIVTTSTTASELIGRNTLRKSLIFKNEDTTNAVYTKTERDVPPTVSSTVHDIKLAAGEAFSLSSIEDGPEAIQDRWTVVAAAGTPIVSFYETEEKDR